MSDQNLAVTCTYTPSSGTIACNPSSVSVGNGNKGVITVNLVVASGSTGSIQFQSTPLAWNGSQPPGVIVAPPNGGTAQVVITETNNNSSGSSVSYSFEVNYTYTPTTGPAVSGTGDPTIINEGTGQDCKDVDPDEECVEPS